MNKTGEEKYERHIRDKDGDYTVKKSRLWDNVALILCLLIAISLWLYVKSTSNVVVEETFEMIPVELRGTDTLDEKGLSVLSISYDTLNVKLKGTRNALSAVDEEGIVAYIELSGINEASSYTLPVKYTLPSGVALVSENEVQVVVDQLAVKHFSVTYDKIRAESWGIPDSCYIDYENAKANIDHVVLEGPTKVLARVAKIMITANASITMTTSGEVSAMVEAVDANGEVIKDSSLVVKMYQGGISADDGTVLGGVLRTHVSVTLPIVKEKTLAIKASDSDGILNDSLISFSPATVTVKGAPTAVDALTALDLGSFSSKTLVNETNGSASLFFSLKDLPEGITSVTLADGSDFEKAQATIQVGSTYELTVPRSAVTVLGGNAALVEDGIPVKLRTVEDDTFFLLLQNNLLAGKGGITLVVNLTDVTVTGETQAPVTVVFSSDFEGKVYEINDEDAPYMATVKPLE